MTNYIHETLRPYQKETLDRIIQSKKKYIVIHAPTGAGKSFYAAQLGAWGRRTLAVVRTKSLQAQYEYVYDSATLYGKGNYDCYMHKTTADLCPDSKCLSSFDNEYAIARSEFMTSSFVTLNYSKYLLDSNIATEYNPEYIFLDECHELSDVTVNYAGFTISWTNKRMQKYCEKIKLNLPQPIMYREIEQYLQKVKATMIARPPKHPKHGGDVKLYLWYERKKRNLDKTLSYMQHMPEAWFCFANERGLGVVPMTARFHFESLFKLHEKRKVVMMSATVGKLNLYLRELGISVQDVEYISVPNAFPAPLRPIYDLHAPAIGRKSSLDDLRRHETLISSAIRACPDDWTGIVHTPSKALAYRLSESIHSQTRRDVFVPESGLGTEVVAQQWDDERSAGKIAVLWQAWEGLDAGQDQICIVSKVPFIDFSNPYELERYKYDAQAAQSRIANKMVQGLGRTRRGRPQDYGTGLVAIADGHWKRFRKHMSKDITDSIYDYDK